MTQSTKKPVFKVGQLVVATGSYNWLLTEGKQYVVIKYEEECPTENFTWPAYVTVIGDSGKPVTGHTHRFRAVESTEPVQYISDAQRLEQHMGQFQAWHGKLFVWRNAEYGWRFLHDLQSIAGPC